MNGFINEQHLVAGRIYEDLESGKYIVRLYVSGGFSFTIFKGDKKEAEKILEEYSRKVEGVVTW